MLWLLNSKKDTEIVAQTIAEAGRRVVGRTRLQKMFYLLHIAGYLDTFSFSYKHYGPFSEDLAQATTTAVMTGLLNETEYPASWGGTYSIFTTQMTATTKDATKAHFLHLLNTADPIELELAATAIFIAAESGEDPWPETARRKPEKAHKIDAAKRLVTQMSSMQLPRPLPAF